MGGTIIALSSEPQAFATEAKHNWSLEYQVYGDPDNTLARYLIKEAIIPDLVVCDEKWKASASFRARMWANNHPFMKHYKRDGVAQPGIAIVMYENKRYRSAYSMGVQPAPSNGFGAGDRPMVPQVWSAFKSAWKRAGGCRDHRGGAGDGALAPIDGSEFQQSSIWDEQYLRLMAGTFVCLLLLLAVWYTAILQPDQVSMCCCVLGAINAAGWFVLVKPHKPHQQSSAPSEQPSCKT